MSNVIETIKTRSSTRGYTAEALTEEELNILIHAGLKAPRRPTDRKFILPCCRAVTRF